MGSLTLVDPGGANELDSPDGRIASGDIPEVRARAVALIEEGAIDEGLKLFVDSTSLRDSGSAARPYSKGWLATMRALWLLSYPILCLCIENGMRGHWNVPLFSWTVRASPSVYRDNARALAQWIPDSLQMTIEGASHGLTWSHAQTFDRELRAFLRAHPT